MCVPGIIVHCVAAVVSIEVRIVDIVDIVGENIVIQIAVRALSVSVDGAC